MKQQTSLELRITYVGGPTALIEFAGVRMLTDPTFDPAPAAYETPVYTLHKTQSPAIEADAIGSIDAVLLSHDHHFDNLDRAGRAFLPRATRVITTVAGAERLGGNAIGLEPWKSLDIPSPAERALRVTATPARHGPAGGDRGPCIGFALAFTDAPDRVVYVAGDTVMFEGVAEVARRFHVEVAILFCGAAKVAVAGTSHLTMTADESVEAARLFKDATIVPLHFEGWQHFSEPRERIIEAFTAAAMTDRLRLPAHGEKIDL